MTEKAVRGNGQETDFCETKSYLQWLEQEQKAMESYHNHKENMAWGATALYFGIIAVAHNGRTYIQNYWVGSAVTVLILTAGYLLFLFVHMQFEMRWVAADSVTGFRALRSQLLDPSNRLQPFHCHVHSDSDGKLGVWPTFVKDGLVRHSKDRKGIFCQPSK